jgi:hypothetical protein
MNAHDIRGLLGAWRDHNRTSGGEALDAIGVNAEFVAAVAGAAATRPIAEQPVLGLLR